MPYGKNSPLSIRSPTSSGLRMTIGVFRGASGMAAGGAGISMLLVLSCTLEADRCMVEFGLVEKLGRATVLSARDLNCSPQFKPSPGRFAEKSDDCLAFEALLACGIWDMEAFLVCAARASWDLGPESMVSRGL